jgi:hypothetical protein
VSCVGFKPTAAVVEAQEYRGSNKEQHNNNNENGGGGGR